MMLSPIRIFTIALVSGACFLNGCATSRGIVSLATPTSDKFATSKGIEIYIQSVVDKRIFEAAPKSPNIPSLDPAEPQNDTIKLRAIARKNSQSANGICHNKRYNPCSRNGGNQSAINGLLA